MKVSDTNEENARRMRLALLGPAAVVLAAYVAFVRVPLMRTLQRHSDRRASLVDEAPTANTESMQARELADLETRVATAKAGASDTGERRPAPSALERAQRRERLAEWLDTHSLSLLAEEQTAVDVSAATGRRLGLAGDVSGRLSGLALEFEGAYLDVLAALRALAEPSFGALPLRLEMRRRASDGIVVWRLELA